MILPFLYGFVCCSCFMAFVFASFRLMNKLSNIILKLRQLSPVSKFEGVFIFKIFIHQNKILTNITFHTWILNCDDQIKKARSTTHEYPCKHNFDFIAMFVNFFFMEVLTKYFWNFYTFLGDKRSKEWIFFWT